MRRLAVYAHYDPDHQVKRYVTHSLERIREDCDRIIFVSTAALPPGEVEKVRPFCDTVMHRENIGFDFAMWRDALFATDYAACDEVVLLNSSVIGPVFPLAPIFARMAESGCDFWGMTECAIWATHLQSYFLVFRSRLVRADAFAEFWRSVLPYRDKVQVIRSYEVGLTRFFEDAGFRYEALVRHTDLVRGLRTGSLPHGPFGRLYGAARRFKAWRTWNDPQNPTYLYPLELLELGVPFVKYELFRDNARRFPLARVFETLEASGYSREIIEGPRGPGA